jgi:hypothetical protein
MYNITQWTSFITVTVEREVDPLKNSGISIVVDLAYAFVENIFE